MRPVKLSLKAFGPYAGTQVLDFSELRGRSFFLIHGPTGSGKTTILDAMCFALYGDTSGAQRDGKQMRSDHADPSTLTEVTFTFTVGADTYRIHRFPEQERLKKRGDGTTTEPAGATLWRQTDASGEEYKDQVLANGTSKVTEAVEKILGFECSQFRQVIMLPQGDFRKLLTANSNERQAILEVLFRTELFRRIEDALKDSAKRLKTEFEQLAQRKSWVLHEAGAGSRDELAARYNHDKNQLKELTIKLTKCKQAATEAQKKLTAGMQAHERFKEKMNAQKSLKLLEVKQDEIINLQSELDLARRAASLTDAESSVKNRQLEAKAAIQDYENKLSRQRAAFSAKADADKKMALEKKREPEREEIQREINRLEDFGIRVAAIEKARSAVETARREVDKAEKAQARAQAGLLTLRAAIEKKNNDRNETVEQASRAAALEAAYREAKRMNSKRQALDELQKHLAQTEIDLANFLEELRKREQNYARARDRLVQLQEAWNRGQAAILAGGLKDGLPCPVCGSTQHPAPAGSDAPLPTEKDLKTGQQAVNTLEALRDKARELAALSDGKVQQIRAKIEAMVNEVGEIAGIDLKQLQLKVRKAEEQWAAAERANQNIATLNSELQQLKEREKTATDAADKTGRTLLEARLALEGAQTALSERESSVPEELRSLALLQAALNKARIRKKQLAEMLELAQKKAEEADRVLVGADTALQAADEILQRARQRAGEELDNFQRRLRNTGFANIDNYVKAIRTKEHMEQMEQIIENFNRSMSAAKDRLERAIAAATEDLDEPDLESLTFIYDQAEQAKEAAIKTETDLRSIIEHETIWLEELGKLEVKLRNLEQNYAVTGHLAAIADGKNAYGITFQRFVLGALLDDVTTAATQRLKLMSKGRYHLHRTLERARKNAAGGLSLEVFDSYTGVARSVNTLSGGETFLASLSLALGLADVVQSYSGGIHLDTIFIDEGFGTLDPESLDFALRALIDLQQDGRLVGIISHVPELKERIDARLEVKSSKKGSEAYFKIV